ncbi:MAG: M15 family metallopeptidase [Ferruginibacter sp.]
MKLILTNKIILRFQLSLFYVLIFILVIPDVVAQDTSFNKYGLWVISDVAELQKTIAKDPSKKMVDLKQTNATLLFDLRYAGKNNFTHQKLYPSIKTTYMRKAAADSLAVVQQELNKKGLGLKIFDAYRPYSVTEKLWEPVKDDRYAADPKKGSGHNRGIAVDLTIIRLTNKEELNMGTGFDNFSDTAHHSFNNLPDTILQNRLLLKASMEKHGFKELDTEWWHYYLPNTTRYELLDMDFKKLKLLNKKTNDN